MWIKAKHFVRGPINGFREKGSSNGDAQLELNGNCAETQSSNCDSD